MTQQLSLALPEPRVVCQFSCGAASACATKLAIDRFGDRVHIINAFVKEEHPDNRRFLADCERWFGRQVTVLRDTKYGASAREVWRRRRFIVGRHGAPCSKALKRDVLVAYHQPGDIIVLGYTADPRDAARLDRYIDANPLDHAMAPLVEAGITKNDCFRIVREAGIELPLRYRQGFKNANCDGCCRGGEGYWNFGRTVWPEAFEETAQIQDLLGEGSYFFRNRKTGKRISLRMLDPKAGRFNAEPDFECGAVCEMPP
jgi:hypothetical protein